MKVDMSFLRCPGCCRTSSSTPWVPVMAHGASILVTSLANLARWLLAQTNSPDVLEQKGATLVIQWRDGNYDPIYVWNQVVEMQLAAPAIAPQILVQISKVLVRVKSELSDHRN